MEPEIRPKLLMITRNLPFPPDRGEHQRDLALLNNYAKHFDVSLITPISDKKMKSAAEEYLKKRCHVHFVEIPIRSKIDKFKTVFLGYFRLRPAAVSLATPKEVRLKLVDIIASESPDILHLAHTSSFDYIATFNSRNTTTVLDLHNVEAKRFQTLLRSRKGAVARIFSRFELFLMTRFEKQAISICEAIFICSQLERESLNAIHGSAFDSKVLLVPNGVTIQDGGIKENLDDGIPRLFFVGSLNYAPNADGIIWFIDEVMPLLRKKFPLIELKVAGHSPPPSLLKRASQSVKVVGYAGDIKELYAEADIALVPLFAGGGTRLKILEAFALKTAVVSTAIGAEGIDVVADEHLYLAEDAKEFVRAISTILESTGLKEQLQSSALSLVEAKYGWDRCTAEITDLLLGSDRNA